MSATQTSGASSFVLLRMGERRLATPAGAVAEMAPTVRLHVFPHTTPGVSGVIVRRGHIVPVYDSASAEEEVSGQSFYLVAERKFDGAAELSAIPVEGQCELATGEMRPADSAPDIRDKSVLGALRVGEESFEVLDFDGLIEARAAAAQAVQGEAHR